MENTTQIDRDIDVLDKALAEITRRHDTYDITYKPNKQRVYVTLNDSSITLDDLTRIYDVILSWETPTTVVEYDMADHTISIGIFRG